MSKFPSTFDAPLFSLRGWPVRAVTFFITLHTSAMVIIALLFAFGKAGDVALFIYNSQAVLQGQVWRLISYAFVNTPSIWFALEMLMLYYFGREVERALGAKKFTFLYLGLILISPLLLQIISFGTGTFQELRGSQSLNFAIFAAFVALHPQVSFFFGIRGKWMLLILLTLSFLQLLEAHQFLAASLFLTESLSALLFMAFQGYQGILPPLSFSWLNALPFFSNKKKTSTKTTASPSSSSEDATSAGAASTVTTSFVPIFSRPTPPPKVTSMETPAINVDSLLEKISKTGMESLSEQEKEVLARASRALLERDKKRGARKS